MACTVNHILIELGESRREEGRRIMEEQHTAIPWTWITTPTYMKWDIQTGGDDILLSFSGPVLEAFGGEGALGDWGALAISEADKAFIVRAVNNHDKLLQTLKYTTAVLAGVLDTLPSNTRPTAEVQIDIAREAIREAND